MSNPVQPEIEGVPAEGTSRRRMLQLGGLTAIGAAVTAACSKSSTPAAASTPSGSTSAVAGASTAAAAATTGFLVWATHVYYNQPALVGISVGFRDFLDSVGWKFQVTAAKTSDDVQETLAAQAQALALKPTAIVATMTDATSFNKSLKAIQDAGIYLELNNTQPDAGNGLGLPFIGQSFTNAAVKSITMVLDAAVKNGHKSGQILLGYCCGNQGAVGTRTAGLKSGLAAYNTKNGTSFTTIELLDTSDTNPATAEGVWQAKLSQVGGSIVGMVCDQVGDPSIDAAKKVGKKAGFVPIVTFDVTDARLQLLEDGWFIGVVDQQAYAQGYISAAQAYQWIVSKTRATDNYDTGSAIITATGLSDARAHEAYVAARAKTLGLAS